MLWFFSERSFQAGIAFPFAVIWIEFLTLNMLFERNAIPSYYAISDYFGSKDSIGYRLYCLMYFIFHWILFFWVVIELSN